MSIPTVVLSSDQPSEEPTPVNLGDRPAPLYEGGRITDGPFVGFPLHHYAVALIDAPWIKTRSPPGGARGAISHCDALAVDEIAALPIAELMLPDSAIFFWVPNWAGELAHDVIRAWGYTYKIRAFTWVKPTVTSPGWWTGLGTCTRQNSESVLLGTRGRPRRLHADVPELLVCPCHPHSRKPDEIYTCIERLIGEQPRVELFARQHRVNWDCWINQSGLFDGGGIITTRRQPSSRLGQAEQP